MENELRHRNEELGQFSSIAAHDLQGPLRNIRNSVQFLAKRYEGQLDETADQFIHHIVNAAGQMHQLVQALLRYAETGEPNSALKLVPVQEIVQAALANLKTDLEQSAAEVICETLPLIKADASQLFQLFQNLIGNALKYRSTRRPEITIRAVTQYYGWLFSISDNGLGIAPERRDEIFAPLKRLHGPEIPGSGIGLAICKKIVERSGGRIWVESEAGQGSTFYFTIPSA